MLLTAVSLNTDWMHFALLRYSVQKRFWHVTVYKFSMGFSGCMKAMWHFLMTSLGADCTLISLMGKKVMGWIGF